MSKDTEERQFACLSVYGADKHRNSTPPGSHPALSMSPAPQRVTQLPRSSCSCSPSHPQTPTHPHCFPRHPRLTIRVFQAEKKPKNQAKTRPKPGKSRSKPGAPGRASKTRSNQDAQKPGAYQEHQEQLTKPGVSGFSPQEPASQNQQACCLVMRG